MDPSEMTAELWAGFTLPRQILWIAAEVNRARGSFATRDLEHVRSCYERALRLLDLTLELPMRSGLRRELSNWRWFVATLHSSEEMDAVAHDLAVRTLLQTHPETFPHIASIGLDRTCTTFD